MRLFVVGDSKSAVNPPTTYVYLADLADSFMSDQSSGVDYVTYSPPAAAAGGVGTLGAANRINNIFGALPAGHPAPDFALVNLGVNDPYPVVEATFKANLGAALDAIHTKYPTTQVLIARIWRRGWDYTALNDTWIPDLISTRLLILCVSNAPPWPQPLIL